MTLFLLLIILQKEKEGTVNFLGETALVEKDSSVIDSEYVVVILVTYLRALAVNTVKFISLILVASLPGFW